MVDELEMPQTFSRAGIEREQRVGEQVCPDPVSPVIIVGRRSGWKVRNAPLRVYCNLAPRVRTAGVFPCIPGPGVITKLTGMRNGMEGPDQLACNHVEGANIARR